MTCDVKCVLGRQAGWALRTGFSEETELRSASERVFALEENPVEGSELMPRGDVLALSLPLVSMRIGQCYRFLIANRTVQETQERRQVMPTWTPTTDQKSLNKRVTTIRSNQFETSSIPI